MSYLDVASGAVVAQQSSEVRAIFIKKTYLHVALALAGLAMLESLWISLGFGSRAIQILSVSQYSWLIVMALFIGCGFVANRWAHNGASRSMQYAGLGLLVFAWSIVMLPMVEYARLLFPGVLSQAAVITGSLVAALTFIVFTTRKDFSFLGPVVSIGVMVAFGVIVASYFFGFHLGTFFCGVMVLLMAASVLYDTSNIVHHYHEDQYVGASLSLFSSIAMMFYYVVSFLMSFAGGD